MNTLPAVQSQETTSSIAATTFDFGGLAITSIIIDEQPWFIAKEVCTALGYANSAQAVENHVRPRHKKIITKEDLFENIHGIFSNKNTRRILIIDEPGLYRLISRSSKPEAIRFEDWVYEEVLPSIRKTGKYSLPNTQTQELQHKQLLQAVTEAVIPLIESVQQQIKESNTKGVTWGRPNSDGLIRPQIALDNARYYIITLGIYDDELKARSITNKAIYTEMVNLTLDNLPERFRDTPSHDILDRNYVSRLILERKRTLGLKPLRYLKTLNRQLEHLRIH